MTQPAYRESTARREAIKRNLMKTAAELWGFQETETENFDPLVDLLFGACATEFEKTERQIKTSETQLLQRLANLLLPEVAISPLPAHAIAHSCPVEPMQQTSSEHQFVITKEITNPANPLLQQTKDLTFTPVAAQPLLQAHVRFLATTQSLIVLQDNLARAAIHKSSKSSHQITDTCWLGLDVSKEVHLRQFTLYINWKDLPEKQHYLQLFRHARWTCQDALLAVNDSEASGPDLMSLIDPVRNVEQQILQYYQSLFFQVVLPAKLTQEHLPEDLVGRFAGQQELFKTPVLWIKVQLQEHVPHRIFEEMTCGTNCFPVMNRKLETAKRPYRVSKKMNILPLKTDDLFLAMHQVNTDTGKIFEALPRHQWQRGQQHTYSVRHESISRFDEKNATEALENLMDSIRDEKAAFESLGGHRLLQELKNLQQSITRLESMVDLKKTYKDITHYLLLNVERDENIWISFWSTTALLANNLQPGTSLKAMQNADYKNNELVLLTETKGGKNKAEDQEKVYNYRSILLSRQRLVTQEDLRAACFARLGNKLLDVQVKKGVDISQKHHQSLVRTIEVWLTISETTTTGRQEWNTLCHELQQYLQQHAAVFSNICVRLASTND